LGTFDIKGKEYDFVQTRILAHGCDVIMIDAGILGTLLATPDITREEVAATAIAGMAQVEAKPVVYSPLGPEQLLKTFPDFRILSK